MLRCFLIVVAVVSAVKVCECDATVGVGSAHIRMRQEGLRLLEKLGLDDRPGTIDASSIPQFLIKRLVGSEAPEEEEPVGDWMIPAQTSPQGQNQCRTTAGQNAVCFWFRLPNDLRSVHVAELAITVDADHADDQDRNHTLVVSELRRSRETEVSNSYQIGTIAQSLTAGTIVRIDITAAVAEWANQVSTGQRILEVVCTTCANDVRSPFSNWNSGSSKPVIHVQPEPLPANRKRRSHECLTDGSCCLNYFYMNFTEIGWDDWIIQPKGYEANYCTGNCRLHQQNQLHSKILRTIAYTKERRAEQYDEQMIPCCAPKRFSPLRIIYAVGPNDIRTKKVNGMKALECGC